MHACLARGGVAGEAGRSLPLVIHHEYARIPPLDWMHELASNIPGSLRTGGPRNPAVPLRAASKAMTFGFPRSVLTPSRPSAVVLRLWGLLGPRKLAAGRLSPASGLLKRPLAPAPPAAGWSRKNLEPLWGSLWGDTRAFGRLGRTRADGECSEEQTEQGGDVLRRTLWKAGTRLCRPLPYHLATAPARRAWHFADTAGKQVLSSCRCDR